MWKSLNAAQLKHVLSVPDKFAWHILFVLLYVDFQLAFEE